MNYGYVRVAAAVPRVHVADPLRNVEAIAEYSGRLDHDVIQLAVFPELCLTGYTCGDLFHQRWLQEQALRALDALLHRMSYGYAYVIGMPLVVDDQLFNCAVVCASGRPVAVIPKSYLPNYKEFYEQRWFAPADRLRSSEVVLCGEQVPIGTDILVELRERDGGPVVARVGVEICEDLWMPIPPSSHHALAGATILVNPSASPVAIGKADYRRALVGQQSARCIAAYAYAGSGPDESSADVVFDGHALIAENGTLLGESKRFSGGRLCIADIDVERLARERAMTGSFGQGVGGDRRPYRVATVEVTGIRLENWFYRIIDPHPFVPSDPATRDERCREVFSIQTVGLLRRLLHVQDVTGVKRVVLGLSGGLDSTLALLTTVQTFDALKLDHELITAVSMPGFGTTDRTRGNAKRIAEALGVTFREIPIRDLVLSELQAIGHEPDLKCLTCQNVQARRRTEILMALGFVVGTGDLSEIALGWCTYNGDHMSMYDVNAGVPKTLVRHVVAWVAANGTLGEAASATLRDILATPVSPELVAGDPKQDPLQRTEELIGPYELHDFFLSHVLRNGCSPEKIAFLAERAFAETYDRTAILKWLRVFCLRFFGTAQFKRDAAPNGPKVGSVALSQRGDWRAPSDIDGDMWTREVNRLIVADVG